MTEDVKKLWGEELAWIKDDELRAKTAKCWELALERSVLSADDLNVIPIAKDAGNQMNKFYKADLPVNMDVLISGAILADVGKLLEYVKDENGKAIQGTYGKYLRHPFSGVSLAEECGISAEICHIIAAHATEGNLVKRSTEAYVVHHADFMTFLPFKSRLQV